MSSKDDPAAVCPVDHKSREAWLAQARANGDQKPNPHTRRPAPQQPPQVQPLAQTSCDSSSLSQTNPPPNLSSSTPGLDTTRVISTIPRAPSHPTAPSTPSRPANSEADTGADKKTGNWIYPSEQMFFSAMQRKNHSPHMADMKTIVPIHNAVNERAWAEIKSWEAGRGSKSCGGPKLSSFSGQSDKLTPRARWNTLIGYRAPFDRHDWVVDRCGERIEYVIDFYAGKEERGKEGQGLNFYLDVRPKLNSWEGWRMRAARYWGW